MSSMDVSLRLKLVNQLSRPAEEAERDLKELQKTAERLGRGGNSGLAQDMEKLGRSAVDAKGKVNAVGQEADKLRAAIGRVDDNAFAGLKNDSAAAKRALAGLTTEARDVRAAISRIDDNALTGLKADAKAAAEAVRDVGRAADQSHQKLRQMGNQSVRGPHAAYGPPIVPGRQGGQFTTAAGAAFDRLGGDAFLPIGAGAAYMLGGGVASVGMVAGASIAGAAGDEFTSDQLRVLGEYSGKDQARYDEQMARIGARKGIGTQGAMNVFGLLMSGGLDHANASDMTEAAIVFGKATQASTDDAARTTIALKNTMGIGAGNMLAAYDAMAVGGKEGQFEVPDMAKNFPSIASKAAALGEGDMQGVRVLVALGQAIRKTAGSSDEASTNFENMLGKFRSPDFIKNAKEYGINVEKTLTGAAKDGQSPVLALLDEIQNKVGNDGFKLAKLMPDVQSLAGLEASLNGLEDVRGMIGRMEGAGGTVMNDFAMATDNASSAFDRFTANVAAKAKFLAAYALPPLTAAMNEMSDAMEGGDGEPQALSAPEGASGDLQQSIAATNDRGARANRFFERLLGFDRSEASKHLDTVDAYQQYARTRMEGERGAPGPWKSWLLGKAADPDFSFKDQMAISLRPTAQQSMGEYSDALAAEGENAVEEAQSIADRIKAMLGFTVSPTIQPTYVAPSGAGGADIGKQSSLQSNSNVKLTQNITSPNPKQAAMRSVREQNRQIRTAQARSLSGIGRSIG